MIATDTAQLCFHCGNECPDEHIHLEEKYFCCDGCKTVYEILDQNNLCNYYQIEEKSGNTPQISRFEFLDNPEIAKTLLDFQNESISKVTFYIPTIHCSSCLYLLENLYRLHEGIERSQVDFLKKQVAVTFRHNIADKGISFRQLAELLSAVGYEPLMSLNDVVKEKKKPNDRKLLTQLGLAGFCAGNIMLFSFPEYLGLQDDTYKLLFGYLNIVLATPVVFYSASGYFESVYKSLRKGIVNIDFPILLSILVAFFRGIYEVIFNHGAGYFDSVTGLIFFLLIGKWFQQKTYHFLSFERDYKSYFPLAVTRLVFGEHESVSVSALKKGDKILIRNGELIPADSLLYKGEANIDYSFVTGEAALERKQLGDFLFAGGRQVGASIEMEVLKDVSQSYLTQLWNNDTFQKEQESRIKSFSNLVGKYFTFGVLTLAFSVAIYWYFTDVSKMLNAFSAILIIACPCTLSLSYPFALGNGLRILGKQHFYLKNGDVIETMANCDTIVFDKTGTITTSEGAKPHFQGKRPLSVFEEMLVVSLAHNSSHPISQKIKAISGEKHFLAIEDFHETTGKGIEGKYHGHFVKLGSSTFVNPSLKAESKAFSASVAHLSIDDEYLGYFTLPNHYRKDIESTIKDLGKKYDTYLLSGDNQSERVHLESWFKNKEYLHFDCTPQEKLSFIKKLQAEGKKVIMIGDGLNDAGALKQAEIGIAVTDDALNFTPMSDGIIAAEHLKELPSYLKYSKFALKLIRFSYVFSLMYNCIGLTFAVQGTLSPIVAAILMPLNSITLVGIASIGMVVKGNKMFKNKE
ncbi:heavy metal translocating P-type ATPase metal-binding domain-containing protein [Arcicella sp. DC2W]|uniref:Heavy metal translocating P-type ATPase metal-binding domain-containing protein n=1 Tax=Arcicella gelida TaxID=2984195 RepID=A0ABU5SA74_9BACT|nr:heavy metal translocating P-type ATPase metal-binding domain-containing protein [Arcicella sp. DC2W]MEA5405361.1 heavy metal translocating P-type ATPase metal-binding domain-containing protein [Arcicella sp. DC2W]